MSNQINLNRYVGLKYEFNTMDCASLVEMFYKDHGWTPDTYPRPTEKNWYETQPYLMQRFLLNNFDKTRDINELSYGDLLYFLVNQEGHIAIYLNNGKFLTTFPPLGLTNGGFSFIDRTKYWFNMRNVKFVAGFKRRIGGELN